MFYVFGIAALCTDLPMRWEVTPFSGFGIAARFIDSVEGNTLCIAVRSADLPIRCEASPFFRFRYCCSIYRFTDAVGGNTIFLLSALLPILPNDRFSGGITPFFRFR